MPANARLNANLTINAIPASLSNTIELNGSLMNVNLPTEFTENIVVGNLSIEPGNDSIDLTAASTLSVRDGSNDNLLTISEATGVVEVQNQLSVSGAFLAGSISLFGNNITINSIANSIDLGAASTLAIRDNADDDIMTIAEATGDVSIGNFNFDVSQNAIVSTSNIIILGQSALNGATLIMSNNCSIELEIGFQFQVFDEGDSELFTVDNNSGDVQIWQGNLDITGGGIQARSGAANPTNTDIDDGYFMGWENTTSGEKRIWWNDGGTMYFSAAFTS
jgi:hypothetical protein